MHADAVRHSRGIFRDRELAIPDAVIVLLQPRNNRCAVSTLLGEIGAKKWAGTDCVALNESP